MTDSSDTQLPDLEGAADERSRQLAELERSAGPLPAHWLQRQLQRVLAAWAENETATDIEAENHIDY